MKTQSLQPTKTCFDDSIKFMAKVVVQNPELVEANEIFLVHGIMKVSDGLISHAWVEVGRDVFDSKFDPEIKEIVYVRIPRKQFYNIGDVQEVKKYAPMEVMKLERESGQCGPWEDRFRALCPDLQTNEPQRTN